MWTRSCLRFCKHHERAVRLAGGVNHLQRDRIYERGIFFIENQSGLNKWLLRMKRVELSDG